MNCNSTLLILAATLAGLCMCCPIGCAELPTITNYLLSARDSHAPLQVRVNVSNNNAIFNPQNIQRVLTHRSGHFSRPNGCSGYFNFTSAQVGLATVCPWRYTCDFDPQRIPAFTFHVRCEHPTPRDNMWAGVCEEVYAPVSYLRTTSCSPLAQHQNKTWSVMTTLVPVACNLVLPS